MSSPKSRSRRTLIIVAIAFLLPVIVAWLFLNQQWYDASTNKGTLLEQPITLAHTHDIPAGWNIALLTAERCDARCTNAILVMNQIDIAVGEDTKRVQPLVVNQSQGSTAANEAAKYDIPVINNSQLNDELGDIPAGSLFIIDPLDNVMLYYPTHADREAMILEGKNALADLRKLLKLSKIG